MSSALMRRAMQTVCSQRAVRPASLFAKQLSTAAPSAVKMRTAYQDMPMEEWSSAFKAKVTEITNAHAHGNGHGGPLSHQDSANCLRELLKSGMLLHTDLVDRPERFFLAHRLLAETSTKIGPGFWIRFTVHYNLCVGTILGLGSGEQIDKLDDMQLQGQLGCFSLTEKFAGVNSGMIVQTTADWNPESKTFSISSPAQGASKNWISQGFVADKTVVVADLRIGGKSYGPHAFMMDLRTDGQVVHGVSHGDMGLKTVGNDLDNAWIKFDNVKLPKSALLNRYADIEGDAQYVQRVKGMPVFHMIGQRLFTGRVAVAQAALTFRRELFKATEKYTDAKKCWSPSAEGNMPLSHVPQLKALYVEAKERAERLDAFAARCEEELSVALKAGKMPSLSLVEAIAVLKVKAVEESTELCHRLRQEVGSFALMQGSGFENTDFLQCCKFAEGDSRILMQKMARDRFKQYEKKTAAPSSTVAGGSLEALQADWASEDAACASLAQRMQEAVLRGAATDKFAAWDAEWQAVYALAEATMHRTLRQFGAVP